MLIGDLGLQLRKVEKRGVVSDGKVRRCGMTALEQTANAVLVSFPLSFSSQSFVVVRCIPSMLPKSSFDAVHLV